MIKKTNLFYSFFNLIIFVFMIFLIDVVCLNSFHSVYALTVGECNNMSASLKSDIENKRVKLTYECFGAKGDGVTNDYDAILRTHDFANSEFLKGYRLTVYATPGKTYYMGDNRGMAIKVITDVDWQKANFIVDDYVLRNGKNVVDTSKSLFQVVSPMYVATGKSVIEYGADSSFVKKVKISSNSTYLSDLVSLIKRDSSFNSLSKYFLESPVWQVTVENSNKQYIRKSLNNNDSGYNQSDTFLINSSTGKVLSAINWNYNDVVKFRVWPIPVVPVTLKNGNFTARTNNVVLTSSGERVAYNQRNIYVSFTGNVNIKSINHYLDETRHPYSNSYQKTREANFYYGFIRLYNTSYINVENAYLSPHTVEANKYGTYDLIFDQAVNVFFNNVNYACNIFKSDNTKDYNACYAKHMISNKVWGIIGSNGSKNVFISNSKVNRIDAHRGITNLYVTDTTVGNKGFTLNGNGEFYAKNVKVDRSKIFIDLRYDYGSSWNGTMVLNNVTNVLDDLTNNAANPIVIRGERTNDHDFGYKTYFPAVYINGLTFDTSRCKNTQNIVLMSLNKDVSTTSSDNTDYYFKAHVRALNLKLNQSNATLSVFSDEFVQKNNNLSINNYGSNNVVNIGYYNSPSLKLAGTTNNVNRLKNKSINTKFSFSPLPSTVTTVGNAVNRSENFFSNLRKQAVMPN